jgi:hypothetical protein
MRPVVPSRVTDGMRFEDYSFGQIRIDSKTYEHDVFVDRGKIRKRKKGPSKEFRADYGHTPLSAKEDLPWKCERLVIGTGAYGSLPVMDEVHEEARRWKVALVTVPTAEAVKQLDESTDDTNAVLHVTC